MEIKDIFLAIESFPWWGWLILFIVYIIVFGDKKLWSYEVKFPFKEGVGRAEVELECFKKRGAYIELDFELDESYLHKDIGVYLSHDLIYFVPGDKNNEGDLDIDESIDIKEPKEGQEITIKIDGKPIFNGQLVLD